MTRVLALDLSVSSTGIADPAGDLSTFSPSRKGDRRQSEIASRLMHIAASRFAELVVLEEGVYRSQAAFQLGMLHGALRDRLQVNGIPYLVVSPASVKTYATGKGNATKPDMRMELFKRMELDVRDDNQVDAWWLRALALDLAGQPVLELPQTHRRALDKLTLPQGATRG